MEEAPYELTIRALLTKEVSSVTFVGSDRTQVETLFRSAKRFVEEAGGADWVGLRRGERVLLRGKHDGERWTWDR